MRELIWRAGSRGPLLRLWVLGLTMAASAVSAADVDKRSQALDEHLAQCTARFGYDPDNTAGLGDYELAPTERDWRQCAYQGIQTIMIPGALIPGAYKELIAQDQAMTRSIERREMTRSERSVRLDQLIRDIEAN